MVTAGEMARTGHDIIFVRFTLEFGSIPRAPILVLEAIITV